MFISSINIVYLIVNKVYFPNDFFLFHKQPYLSQISHVYFTINNVYFLNEHCLFNSEQGVFPQWFFLISQATIFITKSAMFISQ